MDLKIEKEKQKIRSVNFYFGQFVGIYTTILVTGMDQHLNRTYHFWMWIVLFLIPNILFILGRIADRKYPERFSIKFKKIDLLFLVVAVGCCWLEFPNGSGAFILLSAEVLLWIILRGLSLQ